MRDEIIRARLGQLLGRLSPPASIKGNADAMKSETRSLVRGVSAAAPRDGIEEWWVKFEGALLDQMKTRAWPTRFEIRSAAESIGSSDLNTIEARMEADFQQAVFWLGKGKYFFPPWLVRFDDTTRRLIEGEHILNEREARFRGLPLSPEMTRLAIGAPAGGGLRDDQQRPLMPEWRHHIKAMARLRNQTEWECEAQERAEVSPGELPA